MNLSLVRKPSAVYAQTYSEPEKENKEGESPGFLILKQRAVACEKTHCTYIGADSPLIFHHTVFIFKKN